MKKIIFIAIGILLILSGFYFLISDKDIRIDIVPEEELEQEDTSKLMENGSTKSSDLGIFSVDIPDKIEAEVIDKTTVRFSHKVPYEHTNFCNQKEVQNDKFFTDFDVTAEFFYGDLAHVIRSEFDYVYDLYLDENDNPKLQPESFEKLSINGNDVYKITQGVEGCGNYYYIFTHEDESVLLTKDFVAPFSGNFFKETVDEIRSIEGIITPEEADIIFGNMLTQIIENLKD